MGGHTPGRTSWLAALIGLVLAVPAAAQEPTPPDTAAAPEAASAPRPAEPDTVLAALLRLEGYTSVQYSGESAEFRGAERTLRLQGPAEVTRGAERITAEDSLIYRERTRIAEAYGRPVATGEGAEPIEGEVMFYDLGRRVATVRGGRTRVEEAGATWFVQGDVTAEGTERLYATGSTFTSDDRPEPAYHFRVDQMKVLRDRVLVARPARLYFRNVPVMWFPFVVQDLERGRRSGLLTPRFGINEIVRTHTEYRRRISNVGYYWAINDYLDAQLSGDWESGLYRSLAGSLQYRWRRQFLDGNLTYRHYWPDEGGTQLGFQTSNRWQPDERTNLSLVGSYQSSSRFRRETSFDPHELTQDLRSDFSLNRRFAWGNVSVRADRRQSLADDRVETTFPNVQISPRPITLFRAETPEDERWYSNATLSFGGSGSRAHTDRLEDLLRGDRDETRTRMQGNANFSVGNIRWNSSASLGRDLFGAVAGVDTLPDLAPLPRTEQEQGRWQSSLSYQQQLIGTTRISPTLQMSQDFARSDTIGGGSYIGGAPRMTFGAGLSSDLYGFFPGFGPFTALRHRLSPTVSYGYTPEVTQTELQREIFGRRTGSAQNVISLTLNQTWEAKLRAPSEPPADTLAGDSAEVRQRTAPPADPQKVTLLSIATSPALQYDFVRAAEGESGFLTRELTNTISSDYLRGLRLTVRHELFDRSGVTEAGELGRFAPRLSGLSTSFSFGEGSALFRYFAPFLGMAREPEESIAREPHEGDDTRSADEANPPGTGAFTRNPQGVGGGPWTVSLDYSFTARRPTGPLEGSRPGEENQNVNARVSFSPTPNWAVSWNTNYSITNREFGAHSLNLRRNLYRWQADFNFYRTPHGRAMFEFSVYLLDLRDLEFRHREDNLGGTRGR